MANGPLPDACRTQWKPGFTASERTGSGVSQCQAGGACWVLAGVGRLV